MPGDKVLMFPPRPDDDPGPGDDSYYGGPPEWDGTPEPDESPTWATTIRDVLVSLRATGVDKAQKVSIIVALARDESFLSTAAAAWQHDADDVRLSLTEMSGTCHGSGQAVKALERAVASRAKRLRPRAREDGPRGPERPVFIMAPNLYEIAKAAEPVLDGGGCVYQRGGSIVFVRRDGSPLRGVDVRDPWIQEHSDRSLAVEFNRITDVAELRKERDGSVVPVVIPCPVMVSGAVMSLPSWRFRVLEGVTRLPIYRPDGTIRTEAGYDPTTGYLYEPDPNLTLTIPDVVTQEMANAAAARLLDPFVDFPFAVPEGFTLATTPYRSAVLAAVLSVVTRPGVRGPVPFFVFSASTPKSGKTLLIDLVYLITTGHTATRASPVEAEEEMEKRITAILMAGLPMVLIDNVVKVGGPALDAVATAYPRYMGRILGSTSMPEVPALTIWFFSGNNIDYNGDVLFRIIPSHMEPDCEHPENRTGFKHEDIHAHVLTSRGALLSDVYTILRGWQQAGRPRAKLPVMGAYTAWSDVVRQAMVWAGLTDPYAGIGHFAEGHDDKRGIAVALLSAWFARYGPMEMTLGTIGKNVTAEKEPEMWEACQPWGKDGKVDINRLGAYLGKHKGGIYGGFKVASAPNRSKVQVWTVSRVVKEGESSEVEAPPAAARVKEPEGWTVVPEEDDGGPVF